MSEAPILILPVFVRPFWVRAQRLDSGLCQEEGPPPKCRRQEGGSAGSVCSLHPSVLYRLSGTDPQGAHLPGPALSPSPQASS